jgi:hypothetical protein
MITDKLPKSGKQKNLTGGSRKGVPNKSTGAIKDMILTALSNAGGAEYLERRANDPKTAAAFLGLVGKVLPLQVTGADGDALNIQFNVKFD